MTRSTGATSPIATRRSPPDTARAPSREIPSGFHEPQTGSPPRIDGPVARTLPEREHVPRFERVDPDGYGYVARGTLLELGGDRSRSKDVRPTRPRSLWIATPPLRARWSADIPPGRRRPCGRQEA